MSLEIYFFQLYPISQSCHHNRNPSSNERTYDIYVLRIQPILYNQQLQTTPSHPNPFKGYFISKANWII